MFQEFTSRGFQIYALVEKENINAVVKINEVNSGTSVGGSRTYGRGTKFVLNTNVYEVNAKLIRVHKYKIAPTTNIELKQGEVTSKTLKFQFSLACFETRFHYAKSLGGFF